MNIRRSCFSGGEVGGGLVSSSIILKSPCSDVAGLCSSILFWADLGLDRGLATLTFKNQFDKDKFTFSSTYGCVCFHDRMAAANWTLVSRSARPRQWQWWCWIYLVIVLTTIMDNTNIPTIQHSPALVL